jgi:hypothetical protein
MLYRAHYVVEKKLSEKSGDPRKIAFSERGK